MSTSFRNNWVIAIALCGWLLWLLAPVLTPFVAAGLLAYIGDPLADRLQRLKFPRTIAVVSVFVLTFVGLGLLILLVVPLIRTQISALLEALPGIVVQIEQVWLPKIIEFSGVERGEEIGLGAFLARYSDMAGSWGATVLLSLSRSGGALAAAVISLFLIPILTFYLLRDWDPILHKLGAILPSHQRETVISLAPRNGRGAGRISARPDSGHDCAGHYLCNGLEPRWTKVRDRHRCRCLDLVSFVPYLGFVFGIGLAGLTVALEPDPWLRLLGVVATFTIAQVIEGSFLTPKLVGDRIGLHPVLVIFSIAAGGQLFGFFGILLALPAAAVLSVLVRFAYNRYLAEHPELRNAKSDEQSAPARDAT